MAHNTCAVPALSAQWNATYRTNRKNMMLSGGLAAMTFVKTIKHTPVCVYMYHLFTAVYDNCLAAWLRRPETCFPAAPDVFKRKSGNDNCVRIWQQEGSRGTSYAPTNSLRKKRPTEGPFLQQCLYFHVI